MPVIKIIPPLFDEQKIMESLRETLNRELRVEGSEFNAGYYYR